MTRILLLGRDGQVGWELQRSLAPLGTVTVTVGCGRGPTVIVALAVVESPNVSVPVTTIRYGPADA